MGYLLEVFMAYLIIFIGSGIGGILRYSMSVAVQRLANGWLFPVGTLAVNALGCLLIGFLGQLLVAKGLPGEWRLFLLIGFLGGFTTFSSFGYETLQLLRDGQFFYAVGNVVSQVVLGLFFVWLGDVIGRMV